jgi:hypothetical protein
VFRVEGVTRRTLEGVKQGTPLQVRLIPFADAGQAGTDYKVWLPLPASVPSENLLSGAMETRSRPGNVSGSITDDEPQSFVVTFDGQAATEDWFAVRMDVPVAVRRIVFIHGKTFHDGGWFDSNAGKPRLEVKSRQNGAWEVAGVLNDYHATSATDCAGLSGGERFEFQLPEAAKVQAVRIIGKPASGDNPRQAFASCAELQAFSK